MTFRKFILLAALIFSLSPVLVFAQTTATPPASVTSLLGGQGISNCNQTGAYAMSVGAMGATGGSYVPVYDNSVTLNTGYLVYEACVLRPLVASESHAVSSALTQSELSQYLTGNNGNPYFVQNYGLEAQNIANSAFNGSLSGVVSNLNSAFQSQIQTALARNYAMTSNNPSLSLACPYSNIGSVYSNQSFSWAGIFALGNPTCDPVFAYNLAQDQLNANVAAAQNAWQTQLNWGNGNYPIISSSGQVVTPGNLVGLLAGQALLSGQLTAQNATDVGQMVNSLVAGLASQILNTAAGGLASLSSSINGNPSYLAQATAASQQAFGQSITNAALSILAPALAIEQQYNQIQTSIGSTLTQTIAQLRGEENTCWSTIIETVCSASSTPNTSGSGETCTSTSGATLHVATSTEFSQPIIDSQITPIAQEVATNIQNSNESLQTLQSLISSVQDTTDTTAQQNALQQVNQLTSEGALQNQNDVNTATQNQGDVSTAVQTLVTNTTNTWTGQGSDGTPYEDAWDGNVNDPTGWCNANSKQTVNNWIAAWSQ